MSSRQTIAQALVDADVLICAVLVPGAAAPKLVTREMVRSMGAGRGHRRRVDRPGRDVRDVARQRRTTTRCTWKRASCTTACRTCRAPCRMTSTAALTAATLPYVLKLANLGARAAVTSDSALAKGVLVSEGAVTHDALARSLSMPYVPLEKALPAG